MESFEKKIKERNNLLKAQVESLTGRNEVVEVINTLLKAGVAEEDLVEKAKYIRREADGKGGYKYIYSEPKENKIKTDNIKPKFVTNNGRKFELVSGDLSNPRGTIEIKYPDGHIESRHANWTDQYEDKKTDKVDKKEEKITMNNLDWGKTTQERNDNLDKYHSLKSDEEKQKFLKKLKQRSENKNKSESSDLEKAETDKKKKKVAKVMKEFKEGKLKSSSGEIVTDKSQAIAIAMSEAGF